MNPAEPSKAPDPREGLQPPFHKSDAAGLILLPRA